MGEGGGEGGKEKVREELKIKEENPHQPVQLVQRESAPSGSLFCLSTCFYGNDFSGAPKRGGYLCCI